MAEEQKVQGDFATFADLCESGKFVDKYYPQIGKTIRFRNFIPLDRLLQLQARYNMLTGRAGQRDSRGFLVAVLKEVLVIPRVETADDERLLLKANSAVLLDILGEVLGTQEESFRAVVEDLGES